MTRKPILLALTLILGCSGTDSTASNMASGGTGGGGGDAVALGGSGGTGAGAAGTAGAVSEPTAGSGGAAAGEAGSAGSSGRAEPYEPTVEMVTFNIRYGSAPDGENAWPNRRQMVFDVIADMDPDLMGVQEAVDFQLEEIDAEFPDYQRIGVGRDDGGDSGEFSAIYYRATRFDVDASGTFWFSDTPEVPGSTSWGNTLPRICSWGRFIEKDTGYALYHFNVHLDHMSQESRELSAVLLMDRVSEREHPDPFVVTGDFNAAENNLATLYMKGEQGVGQSQNPLPLLDTFRVINPDANMVRTAHAFTGDTDGGKIDYVYVEDTTITTAAEINHTNVDGMYPSDHFPVTATITLPEQSDQ